MNSRLTSHLTRHPVPYGASPAPLEMAQRESAPPEFITEVGRSDPLLDRGGFHPGQAAGGGLDPDALFDEPEVDLEALRASALRQARRLVDFYRITTEELEQAAGSGAKIEAAVVPAPVKYRHPVTGETWDGQGTHPQWMRQALLSDGYRVADLKVGETEEF